jgi:hypothetical protein
MDYENPQYVKARFHQPTLAAAAQVKGSIAQPGQLKKKNLEIISSTNLRWNVLEAGKNHQLHPGLNRNTQTPGKSDGYGSIYLLIPFLGG